MRLCFGIEKDRWYVKGGKKCNVHNDHIKTDKGDICKKRNAIGEPTVIKLA